jgi:hypothetical protein
VIGHARLLQKITGVTFMAIVLQPSNVTFVAPSPHGIAQSIIIVTGAMTKEDWTKCMLAQAPIYARWGLHIHAI